MMELRNKLESVLQDLKAGKMVIVCDESHREDEGDLVMAAQFATSDGVNFMAREARGLICVPLTSERAENLGLSLMVENVDDPYKTKFTVSVDYKVGTTTGISMPDRALTIRKLAEDNVGGDEFWRPGHIFPLIGHSGGLLERRGHTEATLDLLKMAGLKQVGVICEIINDDGLMARHDDIERFAKKHRLKSITIEEIVAATG